VDRLLLHNPKNARVHILEIEKEVKREGGDDTIQTYIHTTPDSVIAVHGNEEEEEEVCYEGDTDREGRMVTVVK
jgi:hypothetical protein